MTNQEYKNSIQRIAYLCSCSVKGIQIDQTYVKSFDLDNLFDVAQKHMLASMVGQILQKAGMSTVHFKNSIFMAQRKAILFNYDLTNVTDALEAAEIWYMPLKGSVLKDYYPSNCMREMCDIDILFDEVRSADVKVIMEKLGFQVKSYGEYNDDDYFKPPVSNFELHRQLFGNKHDKNLYEYYRNVKGRLLKDESNKYGYHLSKEDFYIFMIAHEYKHYSAGGTGLRSLLDTYVYLNGTRLNMEYIKTEVEKLEISDYERLNRELSIAFFNGEKLTEEQEKMLDYIVSSGTYGTMEHEIENKVKKSSKCKYIMRRIFGPLGKDDPYRDGFKRRYATFFSYPILLPILPFYRLFKALRTSPKRIKAEADALIKKEQ